MINPTTSAETVESLSVSYDSDDAQPVNFGDYNDGTTVYVFGDTNASVDLSTGFYGTAVNIDASNSAGENFLAGNRTSNIILGGTDDNSIWGGADIANDILVGGTGENHFICGKYEGNDSIINASTDDSILLYDVTLGDIAFTASDGYTVGILFTTGNVLTISGTSSASADIKLADGSEFWYSYTSRQWNQDI